MSSLDRIAFEACVKHRNKEQAQRIWDQAVAAYEAELSSLGLRPAT